MRSAVLIDIHAYNTFFVPTKLMEVYRYINSCKIVFLIPAAQKTSSAN